MGKIDIPTIGGEEPVFVLRASDMLAGDADKMYKLLAEAHGCDLGELVDRQIRLFGQRDGKKALPGRWPAGV